MVHSQTVDTSPALPPAHHEGERTQLQRPSSFVGVLIALGIAAVFAFGGAMLMPRGPITTGQALACGAIALVVGLGAGFAMGNRWSLLVAPAAYVLVYELVRLGATGPTIDAIHIDSTLGIVALVVGRVAHGVLVLLPMATGALYGVWLADHLTHRSTFRIGSWVATAILTLLTIAVGVSVARPASTAPILGEDGEPLAGSVAELIAIPIGGHDQVVMIRGQSVDNPVLLYLTGGPGGTEMGAMRADTGLEQGFVVATWDQRGAGKSYAALEPLDTLTLDQAVEDTIEVADYLRTRFDEDKVYLVGNSWGSTLGVLAVQQRPDLFHAFVGAGQMVSQRETDIMFWEDTLAWAERTNREGLAETLRENGPPPYADVTRYEYATSYEHDWNPYPEFDPSNEMPAILFVPEYTWMDRLNGFRGFFDSAAVMYPQLQNIDFRETATELAIPFYMVVGEHEARGRAVLADEWFAVLDAPYKERIVFDGAGHRPLFDQPQRFADLMNRVRDETLPVGQAAASSEFDELTDQTIDAVATYRSIIGEVGPQVWPGWGESVPPLLQRGDSHEFLIGHPDPPPGFVETGVVADGEAIWAAPVGTLTPGPAAATWDVGGIWVAMVPLRPVFETVVDDALGPDVIDWTDALYLRALVHEGFHAHQFTASPDIPDFGTGDAEAALSELSGIRDLEDRYVAEARHLRSAIVATTLEETREHALAFLDARRSRRSEVSPSISAHEKQMEWIEGVARYADVRALSLAADAAERSAYSEIPGVEETMASYLRDLEVTGTRPDGLAGWWQALGSAEGLVLDRLLLGWQDRILLDGEPIEDLLATAIAVPDALAESRHAFVSVGAVEMLVAIARDPGEWSQGLGAVLDLGGVDGMLFWFPSEVDGSAFTMEGASLPLDIAFFASDGRLVDVVAMSPCSDRPCPSYGASRPFRYAIEAPAGVFGDLEPTSSLILPREPGR